MLNKLKIGINKSDKDKQQTKSEKKMIPKSKLNSTNVESIAKSVMKDGNHHILNLDCARLEASSVVPCSVNSAVLPCLDLFLS